MQDFDKIYQAEKRNIQTDIKTKPAEFKPETRSQFLQRRTVKQVD